MGDSNLITAAAATHESFDQAELTALLGRLGVRLDASAASAPIELHVALANTREFGPVLSVGLDGLDGLAGHFRKDRATIHAAAALTDADDFMGRFRRTFAYQKLVAAAHRDGRQPPDAALRTCFEGLLGLAGKGLGRADSVVQSLELHGVQADGTLTARQASCRLGAPAASRLPRPVHKIDKLIHPKTIGLIGVSATGMNFGRIILRNLLGSGYAKERLTVIRPGETEIDGVKCVESLKALDGKLDLLIVAVAASVVYDLVDEIIETDAVEAVMLIPGSLGETQASREPAAALAARINAAHGKAGGGPIFLGANCLGVVSHPGQYDSWFIPLERLPKPQKKVQRNSVLLSQSGAFMITRLSRNPWLDPAYMMAMGNQTDLTHGDLLTFFAGRPDIETIGIYVEGFKDGDGLDFAKAVRQAVLSGKQVVVYKSGRTPPGMAGAMGHTASIAGDPVMFEAVVRQAGAIVADDLDSFDDLLYMAGVLHGKTIGGNRLGGISGAGFEAVAIADSSVSDTFAMEMGSLSEETVGKLKEILVAKKLDALVEVRNPIDINPGADDEAHLQITEAFAQDPNIDAVVVGLDPTAPSVAGLEESKLRPGFDITHAKSTVQLMPPMTERIAKPIIGIVDGGPLFDAMASRLMDQGVCVFRNCVRGTRALVRYVEARRDAEAIRQRGK
jgi:acetate---CoA ligase (ADP-forming)